MVSRLQLTIIGVAVLPLPRPHWLVQRTRLGREIRAVAESPRAARILGVNVDRVIAASFFISSALGGAAGVLFGLAFNAIAPDMGRSVELKGLAVIILGGMGSMPGAVIAGFALGPHRGVRRRPPRRARTATPCPSPGSSSSSSCGPRGLLGAASLREA